MKNQKPIDIKKASMKKLEAEYERTWGSKDDSECEYWRKIREEIVNRKENKYRLKFPDVIGGVVCTGNVKSDSIDWKRFYVDEVDIKAPCPTCGGTIDRICGSYISYPQIGVPIWVRMWCDGCEKKYGHADKDGEYQGHRVCLQIDITISSPITKPLKEEE